MPCHASPALPSRGDSLPRRPFLAGRCLADALPRRPCLVEVLPFRQMAKGDARWQ